jgi:Zn-dependent protease with chaperone function
MSALQSARELLPAWVVCGPLLFWLPTAFLVAVVGTWAGTRWAVRPFLRAQGAPWAERARLAAPARTLAGHCAGIYPVLALAFVSLLTGPLCPIPPRAVGVLAAWAAWAGVVVVCVALGNRLRPGLFGVWYRLRGVLGSLCIGSSPLVVLGAVFALLPDRPGPHAYLVLGLGTLGAAICAAGGGVWVARLLGLARPASARLRDIVDRVAAQVGVRPRGVDELDSPVAGAWALPLGGRLLFTPALLSALDDDEVAAVTAHELGHLTEPLAACLARVVPLFLGLALAALVALGGVGGVIPSVVLLFAGVVYLVFLARWSRRLERRADQVARVHEATEGTCARALAKTYEVNLLPVVEAGAGTTHPHLYDRLVATGAPPAYPRPRPPPRSPARAGLAITVVPIVLLAVALFLGYYRAAAAAIAGNAPAARRLVALQGGARELGWLAYTLSRQGDHQAAAGLFLAAAEADPRSAWHPANAAISLATLDRCDEAEAATRDAQQRLDARPHQGAGYVVSQAWTAVRLCRERAHWSAFP